MCDYRQPLPLPERLVRQPFQKVELKLQLKQVSKKPPPVPPQTERHKKLLFVKEPTQHSVKTYSWSSLLGTTRVPLVVLLLVLPLAPPLYLAKKMKEEVVFEEFSVACESLLVLRRRRTSLQCFSMFIFCRTLTV